MYAPTDTRLLTPVTIKPAQARSICRILNKAGFPCNLETREDSGLDHPVFTGVTGGQVAAAAHYIPSLAGLPWLKILSNGFDNPGKTAPFFYSVMLRWEK